ncbi:MAG: GntR family transcriptional regulator, partial [Cycloclasticus sp.]|nr:GntR family transcriptional regulator [Cycloclasticus sp.]MBQ0789902.1 GntR family transcriptional regulator [Cycloclasticus sp.]
DQSYLVYLYLDKHDGRIVASSKIDKFIDDDAPHNFTPQQQVNLLIANSTELGFKAIINNSHWGVLYKNDVFQKLSFGQSKKGFIKRVREDGKIDLSLQGGKETRDKYAKIILNHLEKQQGFSPVHDKSSPEIIADTFGMSKGSFKKAIGGLYKERLISIEKDGIRLVK